jgi:hypothetical protein
VEESIGDRGQQQWLLGSHREPHVGASGKSELGRHHPDDRVRPTLEHHRPADNAGISGETFAPERVAEDRDGTAWPVIVR